MKFSLFRRYKQRATQNAELNARRKFLEQLFYDFNRSQSQVYKMNFFRGIFFGLGSVLGGTVVVAIAVSILSFFVEIPGIGEPIQRVQQSIESGVSR